MRAKPPHRRVFMQQRPAPPVAGIHATTPQIRLRLLPEQFAFDCQSTREAYAGKKSEKDSCLVKTELAET